MLDRLSAHVGASIVAREIHLGKLWAGRPLHLLSVADDLLVAHLARGSTWLAPARPDGSAHRVPGEPWITVVETWPYDNLWFVPAGAPFAIHTIRNSAETDLLGWYVNVQEPIRPSSAGFDYLDRTLDVVVAPDLSSWELKDEDELAQGVETGLYSEELALEIGAAARSGVAWLRDHHVRLREVAARAQRPRPPLHLDACGTLEPG